MASDDVSDIQNMTGLPLPDNFQIPAGHVKSLVRPWSIVPRSILGTASRGYIYSIVHSSGNSGGTKTLNRSRRDCGSAWVKPSFSPRRRPPSGGSSRRLALSLLISISPWRLNIPLALTLVPPFQFPHVCSSLWSHLSKLFGIPINYLTLLLSFRLSVKDGNLALNSFHASEKRRCIISLKMRVPF